MAGTVVDNRTQLDPADTTTGWVASASASQDTEIFIEGTASVADNMTNSLRYLMYNNGAVIGLGTNDLVWIWVNCGIVGLLESKANGGMRIRFAGATVTDFFEVYVGGNDEWPASIEGGWTLFCVNVGDARAAAITNGWTGGTAPTVANVQHVGIAAICTSMPRNADNTWVDSIWYDSASAVDGNFTVFGDNAGADWTIEDIQSTIGTPSGLLYPGPAGSWILNGKMGFSTDATYGTMDFTDTNQLVLFGDFEFVGDSDFGVRFYQTTAADVINFTAGIKTGTGNDATGAQGITFQAAPTGARPEFAVIPNNAVAHTQNINLYGCTFNHFDSVILSDYLYITSTCTFAFDVVGSTFIDCSTLINGEEGNNTSWTNNFLRNSVINPNTADGVAFYITNTLDDVKFCTFEFNDGHAIELSSTFFTGGNIPTPQTALGNVFSGFGATGTNDAALYNNSGKAVTINVSDATGPTYRNGTSASTTINNNVTLTFDTLKDDTEVRVYATADDSELAGIENATAGTPDNRNFPASIAAGTSVYYVIHALQYENIRVEGFTWPSATTTLPVQQRFDRNFSNP